MRIGLSRRHLRVPMSSVMSALSHALDLVEGQPPGHAVRGCILGMRIGRDVGLDAGMRSSLFYALLMKDLGCSSNAAKMCFLFEADDRAAKGDVKAVNTSNLLERLRYALRNVAPGRPVLTRIKRIVGLVAAGDRVGKELIQIRCERGAQIARLFGLDETTANAIHALDEHYDGGGHPDGLIGDAIPVCARVMGLSQTAEVFLRQSGRDAMREMARERRGTWFDPELVDALLAIPDADPIWRELDGNPRETVMAYEPAGRVLFADDDRLDSIALGFAQVIDAKSPWTARHSRGVSEIAVGLAGVLGLDAGVTRDLRRAALLHDVGKLGVSNLILDKPGKLDADELAAMRRHSGHTFDILKKVEGFSDLAELAASHHERLDGKGYHRGLSGTQISRDARILCVADMYEALASKRPYRADMSEVEVMSIIAKNTGAGLCPEIVSALKTFVAGGTFVPYTLAA